MRCPHCGVTFHLNWQTVGDSVEDRDGRWNIYRTQCPACGRFIFRLRQTADHQRRQWNESLDVWHDAWPRTQTRPLSPDVPLDYATDFREACAILSDSPKASAALSRRMLQRLLREQGKVKPGDLSKEIDEAMQSLPAHLARASTRFVTSETSRRTPTRARTAAKSSTLSPARRNGV